MAYVQTAEVSFWSAGGNAKMRGYLEVSVKETSATMCEVTISQAGAMKGGYGPTVEVGSEYKKGSGSWQNLTKSSGALSSHPGSSYVWFAKKTIKVSVPRDGSQYSYRVSVRSTNAPYSGAHSWTTSGTMTITLPTTSSRSVYYNGNYSGAASISPSGPTAVGTAITLRSAPTRSGYTFQCWNTKSDGSGTKYSAGASYTGSSTITLYAIWKANAGIPSISTVVLGRTSEPGDYVPSATGAYLYFAADLSWGSGGTQGSVTVATRKSDDSSSYGNAESAIVGIDSVVYSPNVAYDATDDYDVLVTVSNAQGLSRQYEFLRALPKDGYLVKVEPDTGHVNYGSDVSWRNLWSSGSNCVRWCCKRGFVIVEACISDMDGAASASERAYDTAIPDGYRPDRKLGQAMSTLSSVLASMWVSTDGKVHTQATGSARYLWGRIIYPIF